ncbi:bifunctional diguanylate cyclase/phosphodiesterase [Afifella pfennigii]|uniref:bifunctional diguanylate cyclase/phosphodiesterase n=1 Tax=Afifella pfennigii TaxID=209897 RepID=UPI00047A7A8A|nr:diguanylate cyclase [Afifella pfennigii]
MPEKGILKKLDPAEAYVPDLTPVVRAHAEDDGPAPGATAQAILTEIGETVYEWDLLSDRLRWASNAASALGIAALKDIVTGAAFEKLVDPDSLTNRTQTVRSAIAIDYGEGVPYDITYALLCKDGSASRRIWVRDRGRWYAGRSGEPVLARGAVRMQPRQDAEGVPAPPGCALRDRANFLRLLEDTIVVSRHYEVPFVLALVSIDNIKLASETYGPQVIDPMLNAIALTLSQTVRDTDITGKLGDGEIAIILNRVAPGEAETALQRLTESLKTASVPLRDRVILPVVSVGAVSLAGDEADSLRQCLDSARRALARAQEAGGGHLVLDRSDTALAPIPAQRGGEEVEELLVALREGRVRLLPQPVRSAASGETTFFCLEPILIGEDGKAKSAATALMRAEGLGFAQLVDMRLLHLAHEALAASPQDRFFLNGSLGALSSDVWLANLSRILGEDGNNAGRLIFGFPFAALVRDGEELHGLLARLGELGCAVGITGFDGRFWELGRMHGVNANYVGIAFSALANRLRAGDDETWKLTADYLAALGLTAFVTGVPDKATAERLVAAGFDLLANASSPQEG